MTDDDTSPTPLRALLVAINLAALILTASIVSFAVFLQRESTLEQANRNAATLAATLKQHSELTFDTIANGLKILEERLVAGASFEQMGGNIIRLTGAVAIARVTERGDLAASVGAIPLSVLKSQSQVAKPERDRGESIGLPRRFTDESGETSWAIPLRHRLSNGGWLVALIGLGGFESFYGSLDVGRNGAAGLVRTDGRLLARVPITELGRDASGSEMIQEIMSGARRGAVRSVSAIDKVERIAAYIRLDGFPVAAYVALDTGTIAGFWTQSAASLLAAGVILLLAIAVLSIGMHRSLVRRQAVERQLKRSRDLAAAILHSAADGLLAMDEGGTILAVNPTAERMLGREGLIGRDIRDFLPPELRSLLARGTKRDGVRGDGLLLKQPGMPPLPVSVVVSDASDGKVRVVTLHDRTAEIEHSAKLAVLEKMQMVGQLTGGVAHDFNNILTIISLNLEMLGSLIADSPVWEQYAVPAVRAAKRGSALTSHLLAFARRQPLAPEVVDANAAILDLKSLLERSIGERWSIEPCPAFGLWHLTADPAQLETALVNLALNARDAMPAGGRIVLETRNVTVDQAYADEAGELQAGDYIVIAVTDEGTGIPPEVLNRVFEPFFTTKPPGKGSGLGLSMVFGFAKQSGGHVTIYSEVGRGTTVKLYLPRALAGESGPPRIPDDERELPCLRVLVVEDDDDVRATAVRALRATGMATIEATSAEAALAMAERGVEFDLLFTDVVLPRLTGRQLAEILLERRPSLKVLYTSGYTENAIVHHGRLDPGVVLLSKPYSHAELKAALLQVLATRAEP